uniref:Uncharacterized protein n=1 Tax=Physcomitrium patens TaxID=3218 RepID=A0A7I4C729_PHYPA
MAMASMSMAMSRTPLQGLPAQQPFLHKRVRSPAVISCSSSKPKWSEQCATSSSAGEADKLRTSVGGVLFPFFTVAALVGSTPILEDLVAPSTAIAADVNTTNQDAYKELLQKIKEKRGRRGFQAPAPAPAPVPDAPAPAPDATVQAEQPRISTSAARLEGAAERVRQERETEALKAEKREADMREAERREADRREAERQIEARRAREATAAQVAEREKVAVEKVTRQQGNVQSVVVKKKTHGFLPLFISQFFLLLATLGFGAALLILPENQRKEIQDKVDDFVDKAIPVAEDAYAKAKPLAEQAFVKVKEASVVAKPYVEKAWEQAKPMAAKQIEASKPMLQAAQVKVNELLQEAQKKVK